MSFHSKEESALLGAGFVPLEEDEGMLWEKNGVYYGRQAALQEALRELREEYGIDLYD
jgi:hypothetical protein